MKSLALYIHWPFCKSKCPYCDFNSHVREGIDQEAWKTALLQELDYTATHTGTRRLTSIFFGGGTPSLMPASTAEALITRAKHHWPPVDDIEITLEANPTSVEVDTFANFKAAGINRVSIGIQSFRAEALKFLGREHSADEARKAIERAQKVFDRYSFDLIYALPGQTLDEWRKELEAALAFTNGHISLYQLTIEPGTQFFHHHAKGKFALPEDTLAADLYALTHELTEKHGLPWYEVSNYAAPGQESAHNLTYWRGQEYAGIGPGAHGRITTCPRSPLEGEQISQGVKAEGESWGVRHATSTLRSPEKWLGQVQQQGHGLEDCDPLTEREIYEERIMMGLRLREGIPLSLLNGTRSAFSKTRSALPVLRSLGEGGSSSHCVGQQAEAEDNPIIESLLQENLLEKTDTHIRTTHQGILMLNSILQKLLT